MIDTDKYEGHTEGPWVAEHMYWRKKGSHGGGLREEGAEDAGNYAESFVYTEAYLYAEDDEDDFDIPTLDWASCVNGVVIRNMATANLVADAPLLLEEVKRLREENEQLRKADWEYECLWTWLDENTNLLNTIEPLVEEWKKEMIE